jgi:ATP-dependent Clp protease ATP-binding subunit ClpC
VFERFTDRSRKAVVLAQEEARLLGHNYVGTEHVLLGLVREGEGFAARALAAMQISLVDIRREVEAIIGKGQAAPQGHLPFTPRAKKVLELALREALQHGHNYIGTEHLLLGLIREGEGVAAEVLIKLGADLDRVRQTVIQLLSGYQIGAGSETWPVEEPRPTGPLCPSCRRPLELSLGYRALSAQPAEVEEGEEIPVRVAYCTACGRAIGTSLG